jgi:hypothetical protein
MNIRIEYSDFGRHLAFYLYEKDAVMLPLNPTMRTMPEGEMFPGPTFSITAAEGQKLMEDLISELERLGFRSKKESSPAVLDAKEANLKDLRMMLGLEVKPK